MKNGDDFLTKTFSGYRQKSNKPSSPPVVKNFLSLKFITDSGIEIRDGVNVKCPCCKEWRHIDDYPDPPLRKIKYFSVRCYFCKNENNRFTAQMAAFAEKYFRPKPDDCEGCGRTGRILTCDHVHVDGVFDFRLFRGWLCMECNRGLGSMGDGIEGVDKMRAYLIMAEKEMKKYARYLQRNPSIDSSYKRIDHKRGKRKGVRGSRNK